MNVNSIFSIRTKNEFRVLALEVFDYQYKNNSLYRSFCDQLGRTSNSVVSLEEIPFLPIEFFKSKKIVTEDAKHQIVFSSSGTTGNNTSKHFVKDVEVYKRSYRTCFENFYGPIADYCILGLLPSYLEREGSSLIYMMDDLIEQSGHVESGFYLDEMDALITTLMRLDASGKKVLLVGVSFALLDLIEKTKFHLKHTIIMETGGMKGRRKELIRNELHQQLKQGFGVGKIHSEYGMTELLSQAYSKGNGIFECPPWMKILIRDTEDPLSYTPTGKTGGMNIIDLANINSCSFIATQDLGKMYEDGSFEVLGRFDHSDVRGCNLMVL
ncbi:acyl transferase [Maribacter halichondriae]|uniref:LuxE/PaaK family acyltransferase n=1 Tax=Maribacter halichondriae TaxID=2980554 RepID=UPI00235893AF|nr:acyl transferase [Maribacter sp. Hal144]